MNRLVPRYFLTGDKEKVFTDVPLQLDRLRIDELVVFAQDDKVVSVIVIPLSDDWRFRVGVPAQRGMGVGVSLVPRLGLSEEGKAEEDCEKEVFHRGVRKWGKHSGVRPDDSNLTPPPSQLRSSNTFLFDCARPFVFSARLHLLPYAIIDKLSEAYENLPNFATNLAFLRFSPIDKAMRFLELRNIVS